MKPTLEGLAGHASIRSGSVRHAILANLTKRYPGGISTAELCHAIYANGSDADTVQNIRRRLVSLRKALKGSLWTVPKAKGDKSRSGIYRLEQVQ